MDYFTGKALEYEVVDEDDDFDDLDDSDEDDGAQFDDVSPVKIVSTNRSHIAGTRIPNQMSKSLPVAADHQKVAEVHPRDPT